jgi:hypothetical protein
MIPQDHIPTFPKHQDVFSLPIETTFVAFYPRFPLSQLSRGMANRGIHSQTRRSRKGGIESH